MESVNHVFLVIGVQLAAKIGIIGYRNQAGVLLNLLEENSDCNVTTIYHPSKSIKDARGTNNLSDIYECEAVVIASPNHTHFEYIQKLIKNFDGYIFCEKPPVTSLNELKDLENIPDKKKLKIFFNFNFRFSKLSDNFKKQINSKNIGSIIHIDIISGHGLAFKNQYTNSWRADGKRNLNNILDTVAIHYLDLLSFHLEGFDKSFYFPSLISGNGTSFDTCYLVLKYSNGMTISILNSYATPSIDEILIVGTEGFFSIRNNQLEVHSPRDTFDSRGFFIPPPISYKENFSMQNDYNDSLKKSLNFFISHVNENKDFDIQHFNKSLLTNKLILNLKNS